MPPPRWNRALPTPAVTAAARGRPLVRTWRSLRVASAAVRVASVPNSMSHGLMLNRFDKKQPTVTAQTASGVKMGSSVSASLTRNCTGP